MAGLGENERLWLYEEVLLISLLDEKGKVPDGAFCTLAMGGAILAELLVLGRLGLEGEGKKAKIVVGASGTTGNPLLDECVGEVGESKKARSAADWVSRFGRTKDLKGRVASGLIELGALRLEEGRVLLVFPVTRYPEADHTLEGEVVERLRVAIFGEGEVGDERTAMLVSLLHGAGLLRLVFDKKELKARKARIESIGCGDAAGAAVKAAVEAVQAAMMVAVTSAVAVTAVTS